MPGRPEERAKDHRLDGPNFVMALARSKPIAGIAGRMYPGSFEREIVKNTRQNAAQLSRKQEVALSRWPRTPLRIPVTAAQSSAGVQGKRAIRTIPA